MILEITDGHWVDATFRLGRWTPTTGRDPRNLVQIQDDPKVSRRHALNRDDGGRAIKGGEVVDVPIKGAERVVGVIYVDSFVSSSQSATDDDAAILTELANSRRPCFDALSTPTEGPPDS